MKFYAILKKNYLQLLKIKTNFNRYTCICLYKRYIYIYIIILLKLYIIIIKNVLIFNNN